MVFLANIVFNFHSGFSITLTFLLVNVYLMQNMKKNIEIAVPLFFHNIGPNLAQILLQRPHPLYLFWLIFNEICQGIQLILITSVAIQQFWKKLVKPLKIVFLDPICTEKGSLWATPKMGKFFFQVEITKADHQFPENLYFIKISYVLTYGSFSILSDVFCQKSVISI